MAMKEMVRSVEPYAVAGVVGLAWLSAIVLLPWLPLGEMFYRAVSRFNDRKEREHIERLERARAARLARMIYR
jgi:hypothetical protein